jgi:hypothetical protein
MVLREGPAGRHQMGLSVLTLRGMVFELGPLGEDTPRLIRLIDRPVSVFFCLRGQEFGGHFNGLIHSDLSPLFCGLGVRNCNVVGQKCTRFSVDLGDTRGHGTLR